MNRDSLWRDSIEVELPSFPGGSHEVDVAVIGSGLAGSRPPSIFCAPRLVAASSCSKPCGSATAPHHAVPGCSRPVSARICLG